MERKLDISFDPIGVARRASAMPGVSFLYSGLTAYGLGRYSILAANPLKTFSSRGGVVRICEGGAEREFKANVFDAFESELNAMGKAEAGSLPFQGGPIGYFSYDAGRCLEKTALGEANGEVANARFAFYDGGLVFDHVDRTSWLGSTSEKLSGGLEELLAVALSEDEPSMEAFELRSSLQSNFQREEFVESVQSVRESIRKGDVYQVNLSQRFEAKCEGAAFDLFSRLAKSSPAPYSAYLDFGDEQIVSSSPERFLQVKGRHATTRPIKGTRSAGANDEEAAANAKELEDSEKDRSELLMIVDLERNDLGRVCEPGSIRVDNLFRLERYATVIHQTADVSGDLETGRGPIDCVKAMFPGGSITGAPKIRSMQIIDELERGPRGVYTGSIGYFDANGGADLNIAIRTLRVADGSLSFQVGGGIVWDSDPESEYEETLLKAKAMIRALKGEGNE
ncbi:para-aminobenzoate synthase, component I [Verrucomicrobiia bacterium DG1235]|nr:para-aminobenzoate synthase, component I [Verrucomicrobiae bacterium DG1235]